MAQQPRKPRQAASANQPHIVSAHLPEMRAQATAARGRGQDGQPDSWMKAELYQGMLPHPEHLRAFEDLHPGAVKIVFEQFQEQGNHRRYIEKVAVTKQERRGDFGVWFAFLIGLAMIAAGTTAIVNDHAYEGTGMIGLTIVALTGNFVYGSQGRRSERRDKAAMLVNPERPPAMPNKGDS